MIEMQELIAKSFRDFREGGIVKGHVLEIRPREILVDIGYKSEGVIPASEFDDVEDLQVGDEVEVLLERLEDDHGMVKLSKEKEKIGEEHNMGSSVYSTPVVANNMLFIADKDHLFCITPDGK